LTDCILIDAYYIDTTGDETHYGGNIDYYYYYYYYYNDHNESYNAYEFF